MPRVAEFFGTIIDIVLVLILSVYLCANGTAHRSVAQDRDAAWHDQLAARNCWSSIVNRVIGGYIRGVLLLALLIGVLVGVGMAVLGVPYAVLLGVLAFFMEFIPVLGVFISGAAALMVAIVSFRDLIHPAIVLAYFILVHVIEGDVIGPRIMGQAVGIHPATGLIALVAGTEVFGIWGALFAAPLAGLLQAIIAAAWLEFRGASSHEVLQAARDTAESRGGTRRATRGRLADRSQQSARQACLTPSAAHQRIDDRPAALHVGGPPRPAPDRPGRSDTRRPAPRRRPVRRRRSASKPSSDSMRAAGPLIVAPPISGLTAATHTPRRRARCDRLAHARAPAGSGRCSRTGCSGTPRSASA